MFNLRMLKVSDFLLWAAAGILIFIGFLAIFSSTHNLPWLPSGDAWLFVKRQGISLLLGLLGLLFFSYLDYKHFKKAALPLYALMLVLLFLILVVGNSGGGAQRWIQLGFFSFQPSELAKLILVISLSAYLTTKIKLSTIGDHLLVLGMVFLPFLLIFKQPDLGTALVFIAILMGMLLAAGASYHLLFLLLTPMLSILCRPLFFLWMIYILSLMLALFLNRAQMWEWLLFLSLNIGVGIAMPYIWEILKPYQRQRITAFLNPASDPYGAGYHSLQSKIAIGGGGVLGKGFLHGTQTQLHFIPEQHSDFIFSCIGEEFGFLGALLVVGLFALIVFRAIKLAGEADDRFGELLATGIAVVMAFHVLANVGMTLGLLPVVGIPLPFLSYGGSSLVMNLMALGILQSIAMRRQKLIF